MTNILDERKQVEVIKLLMESGSINGVSRITGVHRATIRGLLFRYGEGCRRFLDWEMRDLKLEHIQCDELFTYNGKKPIRRKREDGVIEELPPDPNDPERGRFVLYVALDEKTKLVPTFRLDRHDQNATNKFISDLHARLRDENSKPHDTDAHAYKLESYVPITRISTDGFRPYLTAIDAIFGKKVEYGRIVKNKRKLKGTDKDKKEEEISNTDKKTENQEFAHVESKFEERNEDEPKRTCLIGKFDDNLISTSLIERNNLTTRHFVKRLAQKTLCFSKKLDNFRAALAIHFAFYNYCWSIKTIKTTPAVAAGIVDRKWSQVELYGHIRKNWPELFFVDPKPLVA